jgi:hypothetical protein
MRYALELQYFILFLLRKLYSISPDEEIEAPLIMLALSGTGFEGKGYIQ